MKITQLIYSIFLICIMLSCSKDEKASKRIESRINNDYKYIVIKNDSIKIHRDDKILEQSGDSVNGQITIIGKYGSRSTTYFKRGWKTKKDYFQSDSLLTSQSHYSQNKLHGKYTEWYANGSLKMKGQYFMGKADSLWSYYYQNGNIQAKGFFNSKVDAELVEFIEHSYDYETGLEIESSYSSNEHSFDGIWKFYDLSGKYTHELKFSNGTITSFHIGKPEY